MPGTGTRRLACLGEPAVQSVAVDNQTSLRSCVEAAIAETTARHLRIASIERHPARRPSSYPTERLSIRFDNGETLELFLKDFAARPADRSNLRQSWQREAMVYRDLLAGANLGTARCYGWMRDERSGRGRLLLEYVPAPSLQACGPQFVPLAAAWLAKLHAFVSRNPDRLAGAGYLVRHDEQFHWTQAQQAAQSLAGYDLSLASRVEQVLKRYERCVKVMAAQERTLVHGSYRPRHILLDPAGSRLCPIDWERAAIGSRYFDLAYLTPEMSPQELEHVVQAYCAASRQAGMNVPSEEEVTHSLNCFRLHLLMGRLREWPARPGRAFACEQIVARVESLARDV